MDGSHPNRWFYGDIRYLRCKNGLPQVHMAEIVGISVSTLRRMERGISFPRVHGQMLWRVCCYFDISADALIDRDLEERSR